LSAVLLGRVVRTIFLLQYVSDLELRQVIQAATNKSEAFNKFVQWVCFGGEGVITENVGDEQRKFIKYNHRVANLLSFHTLLDFFHQNPYRPPFACPFGSATAQASGATRFCLRVVVIIMSVLSFIGSRAAPVPAG
jgi:hypothetical protein